MRYILVPAILLVAACTAPVSDDVYSIEREVELRGGPVTSIYAPPEGSADVISREELAAAGLPFPGAPAPMAAGTSYVASSAAAPIPVSNPGISDEQDFEAVASRESIASDRERLEAQREAYRVIEPEPLPSRPGDAGPNIVAYAINTPNQPGQRVYSRSGFNAQNRFNRNCASYASSDLAQQDFLSRGGPERDRLGLDPDGDGFACYWDPTPFRAARSG